MITLLLPWPDRKLSPNSHGHWRTRAAAVKQARMDAGFLTLAQAPGAKLPAGAPLALTLVFCRPTNRKQDLDNLIASCKALQDGVADALGFNDSSIKSIAGSWGEQFPGGRVEMRLEVMAR